MLKVNVMPRKRMEHGPRRSVEFKMGLLILVLIGPPALAVYFYSTRDKRTDEPQKTLKQECYDQGGTEAVRTTAGQTFCLNGNTIMWRK